MRKWNLILGDRINEVLILYLMPAPRYLTVMHSLPPVVKETITCHIITENEIGNLQRVLRVVSGSHAMR
jgi:hypothetical protein